MVDERRYGVTTRPTTPLCNVASMTDEPLWVVIVIRAWRDLGGPRVRIMRSADRQESTTEVALSAEDVAAKVAALLADIFAEGKQAGGS